MEDSLFMSSWAIYLCVDSLLSESPWLFYDIIFISNTDSVANLYLYIEDLYECSYYFEFIKLVEEKR